MKDHGTIDLFYPSSPLEERTRGVIANIDSVAASEDMNDSSYDINKGYIKDTKYIGCPKGATNVKKLYIVSYTREVIGKITIEYKAS